jgi:hypothetical protein
MLTHKEVVEKMLSTPAVKAAHDDQVEESALPDKLLSARQRTGLTQAEVVEKMKLKNSTKGRPKT